MDSRKRKRKAYIAKKYDLVNDKDELVCVGTKQDAKKLKLFTRSVHIWLINKQGKIMICRRSANMKSYANQITSSAGGHVEQRESYKNAAMRELKEELGFRSSLKDLGKFKVVSSKERAMHHLFFGKANKKIFADPNEISAYSFLSFTELSRDIALHPRRYCKPFHKAFNFYSTVTLLAKLRGLSISQPRRSAT